MPLGLFFEEANRFLRDPRFSGAEIEYKLTLQAEFSTVREAYQAESPDARQQLIRALRHRQQNIITWRVSQAFAEWCAGEPRRSRAALLDLWDGPGSLKTRMQRFSAVLPVDGVLRQRGTQLCVGSTLLMALSAEEHPPVRTKVLTSGFTATGMAGFGRDDDSGTCYERALEFFDTLVAEAPRFGLVLQSRLEAQGATWCVSGGWKKNPPAPPSSAALTTDEEETLQLIKTAANGKAISETEKQALVASRRGQGQFRRHLIGLWGKCAVTGCAEPRLLRASHLKPWKVGSNAERLDPFNGILLAPHLDAALDCGMISFADDGQIILSEILSPADRKALRLDASLRLARVYPQSIPYLKHHREHCLQIKHAV